MQCTSANNKHEYWGVVITHNLVSFLIYGTGMLATSIFKRKFNIVGLHVRLF